MAGRGSRDPHKLSATLEVVDERETVLVTGRFATDKAGYAAMRKHVAAWPDRTRAVEGSNGAGPARSTLRISHFPDPRARRYNRPHDPGRPQRSGLSNHPVDKRGEPI